MGVNNLGMRLQKDKKYVKRKSKKLFKIMREQDN